MDERTRELERGLLRSPEDESIRQSLVTNYLRGGDFLLGGGVEIYHRGIFEGDYFSCFMALHLMHAIISRGEELNPACNEWSEVTPDMWLEWHTNLLLGDQPNDEKLELFFNDLSSECIFYPRVGSYGVYHQQAGNPWIDAEGIVEWARNQFNWVSGRIRTHNRASITWEGDNGRDVPGPSTVTIEFDWPKWFHSYYPSGPLVPTDRHGELPACSILYTSPTPEMKQLLSQLSTKFFNHRALPDVPPLEELYLSNNIDGYGEPIDYIALHMRGDLVMPNCRQLEETYRQQYPHADGTNWPYNGLGVYPVCVKCPTCDSVYSVFKDGGEESACFCEQCQFTLIEGYADNGPHLMAFARQQATAWVNIGSRNNYPLYIPDDCPLELQNKIMEYFAEKYQIVAGP